MEKTNIIRLANEFILENGIVNYPLKLESLHQLSEAIGFYLFSYNEADKFIDKFDLGKYKSSSAFTFIHKEKDGSPIRTILYKDELSYSEKLFCILHEIGHIYLNHTYNGVLGKSPDESVQNHQENEANAFAYEVAAPICILNASGVKTIEEIQFRTLLDGARAEHVLALLTKRQGKENDKIEQEVINTYARNQLTVKCKEEIIGQVEHFVCPQNNPNIENPTWIKPCTILGFLLSAIILILSLYICFKPSKSATNPTVLQVSSVNASQNDSLISSSSEQMVFVGKSGDRYHIAGCQYVNDNMIEVTVSEAEAQGYTPCKRCIG